VNVTLGNAINSYRCAEGVKVLFYREEFISRILMPTAFLNTISARNFHIVVFELYQQCTKRTYTIL